MITQQYFKHNQVNLSFVIQWILEKTPIRFENVFDELFFDWI